jgi:hypothetical protein
MTDKLEGNETMKHGLKDSGQRNVEKTGCLLEPKDGHGRFDLIPPEPLFRVAKIYEQGSIKYAPNNWKKGMAWSKCLSALERHLQKWKRGDRDEDHLAMVLWRTMALMYYEEYHQELCDIDERNTIHNRVWTSKNLNPHAKWGKEEDGAEIEMEVKYETNVHPGTNRPSAPQKRRNDIPRRRVVVKPRRKGKWKNTPSQS